MSLSVLYPFSSAPTQTAAVEKQELHDDIHWQNISEAVLGTELLPYDKQHQQFDLVGF